MLTDMMNRMLKAAKSARTCMVVYFHNLGQFDGLFILRHLTMEHRGLLVDPMVRNRVIYKITVYTVSVCLGVSASASPLQCCQLVS